LTLSIGAANVLAIAPDVPPKIKSLNKFEVPLPDELDDPCGLILKIFKK
jgi:hypothetical protein